MIFLLEKFHTVKFGLSSIGQAKIKKKQKNLMFVLPSGTS